MIFIIKGFWTIIFIFIVISTKFRPICPPAFRCLSNSGTYTGLRTTSFTESTKKAGGHIGRTVVEITAKMKTIVREPLMIKKNITTVKLRRRGKLFKLEKSRLNQGLSNTAGLKSLPLQLIDHPEEKI